MKPGDDEYKRKIEELEARLKAAEKERDTAKNENAAYKARVESPEFKREVIEETLRRKKLDHILDGIEMEDPAASCKDYYEPKPGSIPEEFLHPPKKSKDTFDPFGWKEKQRQNKREEKEDWAGFILKLALACLVVFLFYHFYGSWQENETKKTEKAKSMTPISATTIANAFANSPQSANQKYKDERIKVSGEVTFITIVDEAATITIDAGDRGMVYAYFNSLNGIRNLKTGDKLTFIGDCEMYASVAVGDYTVTYVYFYNCKPA